MRLDSAAVPRGRHVTASLHSALLVLASLAACAGCDHHRAGPWASADAGILERLAEVWCGTQDTCLGYSTPCCWETIPDLTPEREALVEQCLEETVLAGCDITRTIVSDGGTVMVDTTSAACRSAAVMIGQPGLTRGWGPHRCSSDWYLASVTCTCRDDPVKHGVGGWGGDCEAAIAEGRHLGAESCSQFGGVTSCQVEGCRQQLSAEGTLDGGR